MMQKRLPYILKATASAFLKKTDPKSVFSRAFMKHKADTVYKNILLLFITPEEKETRLIPL